MIDFISLFSVALMVKDHIDNNTNLEEEIDQIRILGTKMT